MTESKTTLFSTRDRAEKLFRKLDYAPNSGFGEEAIPVIEDALLEAFGAGKQEGWNDHKEIGDVR